jgi:hypothetical protein
MIIRSDCRGRARVLDNKWFEQIRISSGAE